MGENIESDFFLMRFHMILVYSGLENRHYRSGVSIFGLRAPLL